MYFQFGGRKEDTMVTRKKVLSLAAAAVVVLATAGILYAITADYDRPNPLMDYTPQELAIYDTGYWHLGETDCRQCHGDSLADRHHFSDTVLVYGLCTPCHALDPNAPGGVVVIRDCTTSGCHHWNDVLTQPNGWHHNTDLSGSENCTACHDPAVINEITNFRDMTLYPPSVVTPTPFSCENCHWKQAVVSYGWQPGDADPTPANAGHPSDYNHYDQWGGGPEYWEYGKQILHNYETHHMGGKGNVQAPCWNCHGIDPNDENYDETDPELIRYCEICHDMYSLHTIYGHIQDTEGWEATGFHVDGAPNDEPDTYREFTVWDGDPPDGPINNPTETDEICFGCHGDNMIEQDQPAVPCVGPTIVSVEPKYFTCKDTITIRGTLFGQEHPLSKFQLAVDGTTSWIDMVIVSWTDTQVEAYIPCNVLAGGTVYKTRIQSWCDIRDVGPKVTYGGWIAMASISPTEDACGYNNWITLTGGNFGTAQTEWRSSANNYGVYRTVEFVSSQYGSAPLVAQNYRNWSNTSVEVGMYGDNSNSFFEDDYLDASMFEDAVARRNHIKDTSEEQLRKCVNLFLGNYEIWAVATYFEDTNDDDAFGPGDIITQVVTSDPEVFDLTDIPYINALNPKGSIEPGADARLKLYGANFGPVQGSGEVRIGRLAHYNAFPTLKGKVMTVKGWSSTRIKIKVGAAKFPAAWKDTFKYVWVIKNGQISNAKRIKLLAWP